MKIFKLAFKFFDMWPIVRIFAQYGVNIVSNLLIQSAVFIRLYFFGKSLRFGDFVVSQLFDTFRQIRLIALS